MADNTTITPGAGVTIATDDVASIHYQRVKLVDGTLDSTTPILTAAALADAVANPTIPSLAALDTLFNGTTWDRRRGNVDLTVLASAARTASLQSADQVNYNGRGLDLVIDVTAVSGTTPTLTITIQGKDVLSGKYYTLLASAAISTVSTTILRVYPGLAAAANSVAGYVLPRLWRVDAAIAGTTPSFTFSVGSSVIV